MWSQWPGALTAPMPPMPMTAAPPQPAAPPLPDAPPPPPPSNAITVPSTGFIGPLQPSATMSAGATIANTTTGNGNPYEQYTAAQYAAMTPEQQYALQQHWQQWQTYQQEYAKWHAQYGEQYKREMAAAAAAVSNPVATTPNSYMTPSYYPQAQTSAQLPIQQTSLTHQPPLPQAVRPQATRKIMGQPQMYAQPPPAAAQQHTQWTPQQQMPSELNMVPVNYNQPPPTFNTQDETSKFSIGNINQEQKMSITSLRNHIADGTPGAGFNSQWQNPLPIQNKSGSSMWSSADNHKESNETKSNASNLNLWPQSSQNRGKANNFEINREETNKDGNDAESLPSSRKSQNVYVSPNKCDEGVNSNIDSSGSEKRFVDNNAISSDFDKDRPNKFGNNGPRNYGKKTKFENNGSKIFDNKNGQNPFGNNFGNVPLNNFVNTERGDFDDAKGFGNHPLPSFGRSNNSNCQKNFDNNIPDHFNNSGCRNNQGWNLNDFNNQSDYNNWDNDAKTNQNFSPGDSINNFKSGGGGFNRPTGTNQQNYRSGGWQQQTTRKPELDDTSFDRMFEQWEKQFEDWKRANINHPDREEYRRYEQEFEKQRRRIMERREQMRRRRMGQMSANITATTNTDFLNLNQSEQQVQHNQPLHQQQSQQLHQPQQLIQEQRHSWRQQSQWQDDKQNTQEMAKSVFDMEDQRNSPKQRKITQAHNNDKSNTTNVQLNEISQIFNKQTDHNTSKNQTSQEPHTLPSLQAKQNPQNQELQQKQTLWLPNRTQQVTTEDSNEHKQQKSSQDEQKKPEQHQEGEHQKQSQIQRGFVQKQIQQNTQQRDGTQQKHNPQCPHQKQYQSNTNQSSNQQQKSTLTSLQQKQNQLKQNPPLKSNQQTSMQNLNQEVNQKKNEQKSQQLQKSDKQSPQRNPDTSQKLNQTTQKFNLNQNQNSLEQKQVQGSGDQAKTPKLNQLKPLPQRQMPQQRRQALQQASAANKQPLESNKTVYKNNKTPEIEKTSTKADQQTASGSLLGKRKSRFNPQDELIKEKREAKHSVEVITLDDDDDDDCKGSAENNEKNSVNSIFKKSEGIPGLDLVDESESKNLEDKSKSADTKSRNKTHDVGGRSDGGDVINKDRTVCNVNSKIPSLFDVVIEKPPDLSSPPPPQQQNLQFNKNVDNSALMAQLQSCNLDSMANVADALKDPQFLQQISLAVARVQGHDVPLAPSPQLLEQLPGLLQQMQQQQQQHSPTAIGSSYRSDRLYLNETQRSKNATSSSSKEKSLPTHLLQQQQVGNEGISPPLSFAEWQRRKCLASNDVSNMCGPSLGNNGSQNFNDNTQNFGNNGLQNFRNERPNMFCNNGPNNFSHNDAGRYNNFRNDQMINPSDFNNRRNFGLSGNNNNGGPCFNRGVGPMSAGGGSFNKNNCFGDNPFKRSSGLPPPVLDDNIGGARGTFSGSSGGFDKSGSGRFGEMIGRFSDPCTGGFSGSVGGGGFGGPVGEQSNMDFMRRSMRNNNACAVGNRKISMKPRSQE